MPDVTRLLDRMEETGWIVRERGTKDRRYVSTHLSKKGRDLVHQLDEKVAAIHAARFRHVDKRSLKTLVDLLEVVRGQ